MIVPQMRSAPALLAVGNPNTDGCIRWNAGGRIPRVASARVASFGADRSQAGAVLLAGAGLAAPARRQRCRIRHKALNQFQRDAVRAPSGAHLVVAGAGSGKTKTLTERLAYLVREVGVEPQKILLVTFTRKAAEEMKARSASLVGAEMARIRSGTFHALCLKGLQRYQRKMGFLSGFSVLDDRDSCDLIRAVTHKLRLNGRENQFPTSKKLRSDFSYSVNTGIPLQEVCLNSPHFDGIMAVREEYEAEKKRQSQLDFDDLLLRYSQLLEDEAVRLREARSCEHILVDEYQDTNPLQATIVKQLSSVWGNVLAVGDDAQCIYGFRGADVRNIRDFSDDFPESSLFKLQDNYRSTQQILDLSNAVLQDSEQGYRLEMRSHSEEGPLPVLQLVPDQDQESQWVASEIHKLHQEGIPLANMAVLYRFNRQSISLEPQLLRMGIDYTVRGARRFTDKAHVKDLLAVLLIALNPERELQWTRILRLFDGIGPTFASKIVEKIRSSEKFELDPAPWAKRKFYGDLCELRDLLLEIRGASDGAFQGVRAAVKWYAAYLPERLDSDDRERKLDLDAITRAAIGFDSLADFVNTLHLEDEPQESSDESSKPEEPDSLALSTVHSAKGLEWEVVFVLGCGSAFRPHPREDADETRRVLYVALTRAKRSLYLTCPGGFAELTPLLHMQNLLELVKLRS